MPRTASGKRMTPNTESAASKLAFGTARAVPSMATAQILPAPPFVPFARARIRATILDDASTASTWAPRLAAASAAAARSDVDQPVTGTNAEEVERATGEGEAQRLEYRFVRRNVIVPARRLLIWLKACREIHETSRRAGTRHVTNVAGRRDRYEHRHFTI